MANIRYIGSVPQGEAEHVPYALLTTGWGGTPTSVSHKVLKYISADTYTDVTSTCAAGSATVSSDTITLPKLIALVRGVTYRIEVAFTSGGADWVAWFQVRGER